MSEYLKQLEGYNEEDLVVMAISSKNSIGSRRASVKDVREALVKNPNYWDDVSFAHVLKKNQNE